MGRMETYTVYCAALGGTWRVATIVGAQALHTLSEFFPATGKGFRFIGTTGTV